MKPMVRKFDALWAKQMKLMPKWFDRPMHVVTFFGEPVIILPILIIFSYFAIQSNDRTLLKVLIIGLVGIAINSAGKWIFARKRPDSAYVHKMWLHTFSFPSGHSGGSMITYGMCSLVLWYIYGIEAGALALTVAILASLLIGISRVYLEAHYMSDVIAGWIIGLITLSVVAYQIGL